MQALHVAPPIPRETLARLVRKLRLVSIRR